MLWRWQVRSTSLGFRGGLARAGNVHPPLPGDLRLAWAKRSSMVGDLAGETVKREEGHLAHLAIAKDFVA